MNENSDFAYITKAECGCYTGAMVANLNHKKDLKTFLCEAIDNDETIERVPVEFVREHMFDKCSVHNVEQLSLLPQTV